MLKLIKFFDLNLLLNEIFHFSLEKSKYLKRGPTKWISKWSGHGNKNFQKMGVALLVSPVSPALKNSINWYS